jgi:hypothetical protein
MRLNNWSIAASWSGGKPSGAFDANGRVALSIPAFSPDWFMRAFDATLGQRENHIIKE